MSKLKGNSNIVSIEDYDVMEHTDEIGWDILIRMELLTPMNKYFAQNSPKTRDVIKLGIDICKALEVCQKFNIVHRDIKPSNIFVSGTGEFKLGDFGVARTLEKTSSGLSKKGTYTYMAPEVYRGEAYGSNVDIYSLGIVMYRLLNNNMEPFKEGLSFADADNALVRRMKGEDLPKPANAQGRLAEIILKSCSFDPKDRYESPLQMRSELESILYSEEEERIIHPGGEALDFEPSDVPDDDEPDTMGLFDEVPGKEADEGDDETVGLFGKKATESGNETVELFDKKDIPVSETIDTGEQNAVEEEKEEKKKTPLKGILTVCSVVILLGIIAAAWWITGGENTTNDDNSYADSAVMNDAVEQKKQEETLIVESFQQEQPAENKETSQTTKKQSQTTVKKDDTTESEVHRHKETVIPAVAATCTATGKTEGIKCSDCGAILREQEIIPQTPHNEVIIPTVEATCQKAGNTEGKNVLFAIPSL